MSKIDNNPILKGLSGMLGNLIVYREIRGRMIMANRPKRTGVLTEHQLETKSRFKRAVQYARKQLLNEASRAEYEAKITNKKHSAYLVAVTDYMTAPQVNSIDVSNYNGVVGDVLSIEATDDFKVKAVEVIVTSSTGAIIERGPAVLVPDSEEDWEYTITTANPALSGTTVKAVAVDKPNNIGQLEVKLP